MLLRGASEWDAYVEGFEVRDPLGCVDESEFVVEDKVTASLGQQLENLDKTFRCIVIGLNE